MATQAIVVEHPCRHCDGVVEPELVSIYPSSEVCLDCMPKAEIERLQKDLNQVQRLDRALLPQIPLVPGCEVGLHYRASRLINGDFYDVRAEGSRVTLLLGDVMGKGIPAALLRTGLQGSLKALVPEVSSPAAVLEKATYVEKSVQLDPGDVLALFSDGFTEAENSAGDIFDERHIARWVDSESDSPAQVIASTVADQLARFAPGEPSDDRTLMMVKRI